MGHPTAQAKPVSKVSCHQVPKQNLEQSTESYTRKTGDSSERGLDLAAMDYQMCLARLNDQQMGRLPIKTRTSLRSLRKVLDEWSWAFYGVVYFGGTLAMHAPIRAGTEQEELITAILNELTKPEDTIPSQPVLVEKEIRQIRQQIARVSSSEWLEDEEKSLFAERVQRLNAVQMRLEKTLPNLPPAALRRTLAFLQSASVAME